ncbi:MAG: ModD protein [Azospirillaceae bacterium]|nr:ModD protein [Azospirillaceae bacterium]
MMLVLSDRALDELLAQDVPQGDLTTRMLGIGDAAAALSFAPRQPCVIAAIEEAERLFQRVGATTRRSCDSGAAVDPGTVVLTVAGPAEALHQAWKVAQTLVEYASGIATRTRRIVSAARAVAPEIVVAATRKNFPGTKEISSKSVLAGGGVMHRLGLSETLLVFPEHRLFLDDGAAGSRAWIAALKRRQPEKKVVVETDSVEEALALAQAGVDVIQLEKLAPDQVAAVVTRLRGSAAAAPGAAPVVAAAGGIDDGNAAAYAATGCDVLVTSAPYFGKPLDIQVKFRRNP